MSSTCAPLLIMGSSWTPWLKPSKSRSARSKHFRWHHSRLMARCKGSASSPSALAIRKSICGLVSRLINKCSMFEAAFDLGGRLGPAERLGVLVPGCEPACDRGLQPAHAVEAAAPDGLTGNQGEPAFHQVEPGRPSGCEVQMETRMSGEPLLHRRVLVRPVVVADQVNLAARIAARERVEKGDELSVPMAPKAARMDLAAGHLQGGEQAGGAVACIVVSHARGQRRPHRPVTRHCEAGRDQSC